MVLKLTVRDNHKVSDNYYCDCDNLLDLLHFCSSSDGFMISVNALTGKNKLVKYNLDIL